MTTFLTFNRENPIHRIKSYLGSGSVSESGSGSIITDADPHQNDTDPKHWLLTLMGLTVM